MSLPRSLPRTIWVFAALVVLVFTSDWVVGRQSSAAARAPGENGRPAFAGLKNPDMRQGLFERWKAQHRSRTGALTPQRVSGGVATSTVGRPSMVVNSSGTLLFTKQFPPVSCDVDPGSCGPPGSSNCTNWLPNTAYASGKVLRASAFNMYAILFQAQNAGTSGATEPLWPTVAGGTIPDGTITWKAIGYDPAQFTGCSAMQLVSRTIGGVETPLATEGDDVGGGVNLSGWGEFVAFNNSGVAAFKAATAGVLTNGDEGGVGLFRAGPGAGALTELAQIGDTIGGRQIFGVSTMVGINDAGQILWDGYAAFNTNPVRKTWTASTGFTNLDRVLPTSPGLLEFFLSVGLSCTSGSSEPAWPPRLNQTVTDGTCTWTGTLRDGNEDDHGIYRFTPGTGHQLLFANGTTVSAGVTVAQFGQFGIGQYDVIDGFLNSLGHTATTVTLSNGQTAAYLLTGPGTFTEVARSTTAGPGGTFNSISPRTELNNCDQVVFRADVGGTVKLIRWTPPSTFTVIASVGDDLGTRSGGPASGVTISDLGFFADINNVGNVVFGADVSPPAGGTSQSYLFWDGGTGLLSEIIRVVKPPVQSSRGFLPSEMITLNDCNSVAFVTGSTGDEADGEGAELDETALHTWTKLGGVVDMIKAGDVIGGLTVSSVNAQHHSFAKRQLSSSGCVAVQYYGNGISGGATEDQAEGNGGPGPPRNGGIPPAGQLFVSCPQIQCQAAPCGAVTPTPTPTGTQTVTPTPTPTSPPPTATPTFTPVPVGVVQVPTLSPRTLVLLGLILAAAGLLLMKRR